MCKHCNPLAETSAKLGALSRRNVTVIMSADNGFGIRFGGKLLMQYGGADDGIACVSYNSSFMSFSAEHVQHIDGDTIYLK